MELLNVLLGDAAGYHVAAVLLVPRAGQAGSAAGRHRSLHVGGTTRAGFPPSRPMWAQDGTNSALYPHNASTSSCSRAGLCAVPAARVPGSRSLASLMSLTRSATAPPATLPLIAVTSCEVTQLL